MLVSNRKGSGASAPGMLDGLLGRLNDWKEESDIVRLTFKALSDVIRQQGDTIERLRTIIERKVDRAEFEQAVKTRKPTDVTPTKDLNE
jgi:hypothetical protein